MQQNKTSSTKDRTSEEVEEQPAKVETPAADEAANTLAGIDEVLEDNAIDSMLDEIDDVLEENAEQFVNGFVQRGGE